MSNIRRILRAGRDSQRELRAKTELEGIYDRFRDYTMIPSWNYVDTLRVAKKSANVDGCVVQCGVWRGGLAAGLVTVLGADREYFLYDSFEGLPDAKPIDGQAAIDWQADKSGIGYYDNCSAPIETADEAMKLAGAKNYRLIKGWFDKTIAGDKPATKIACLHLDCDWYDSMYVCLEQLFDCVATGGYIILDDYYYWDGAGHALHDFLSARQALERISNIGEICYLVKK
jgi:O-methyltransferase